MSDLVDRVGDWDMELALEVKQTIAELEGDLEIMRLQRDATRASRCPKCAENEALNLRIAELEAEIEENKGLDKLCDQYLADNARLRAALAGLLEDTQHSEHYCGDDDCPVAIAEAALKGAES